MADHKSREVIESQIGKSMDEAPTREAKTKQTPEDGVKGMSSILICYRVQRGDTLASIASTHNMQVKDIEAVNGPNTQAAVLLLPFFNPNLPYEDQHLVGSGEDIAQVARAHHLTIAQLEFLNPHLQKNGGLVLRGDVLIIRMSAAARKELSKAKAIDQEAVAPTRDETKQTPEDVLRKMMKGERYWVKLGDTLESIASAHNMQVKDIEAANPRDPQEAIERLGSLNLPFFHPDLPYTDQYVVGLGDDVAKVARANHLSIDQLEFLNPHLKKDGGLVLCGDVLIIRMSSTNKGREPEQPKKLDLSREDYKELLPSSSKRGPGQPIMMELEEPTSSLKQGLHPTFRKPLETIGKIQPSPFNKLSEITCHKLDGLVVATTSCADYIVTLLLQSPGYLLHIFHPQSSIRRLVILPSYGPPTSPHYLQQYPMVNIVSNKVFVTFPAGIQCSMNLHQDD